MEGVCYCACL